MRKEEYVNHRPVAIYNADESKLIAITATCTHAVQFIFGPTKDRVSGVGQICGAMVRKFRILPKSSQHTFKIAVRPPTLAQLAVLGDNDYTIIDESLKGFSRFIHKGFWGTAESMRMAADRKRN